MTVRRNSNLTRRDSLSDFDLFSGWPFQPLVRQRGVARDQQPDVEHLAPPVEIREDEKAYTIHLEVPGVPLEAIKIESHKNVLTVKGHKEACEVDDSETCHVAERSYGAFSRTFRIPNDSNEDQIAASYSNGVLEVQIPKVEPSTPTTIQINS
jgi:HSP20 family protein